MGNGWNLGWSEHDLKARASLSPETLWLGICCHEERHVWEKTWGAFYLFSTLPFFNHCHFALAPLSRQRKLSRSGGAHVTLGQLPSLNQIPQGLLHHHFFSSCCLLS